jgi:RNA polymerase sigma-70 factor (ECF subfamily)
MDATLSIAFLAERSPRLLSEGVRMRNVFAQNYAGVWRFLRRMGVDADRVDDAAQNVFLVALEAFPRIAEGSERAFLFATAVRVAYATRRKFAREVMSEALDAGHSSMPAPDQLTDQKRAREILDAMVDRLSADVRPVFVLAEVEQFKVPEIADLLGIPIGTAASRLRRGRDQFRAEVARAFGGDNG